MLGGGILMLIYHCDSKLCWCLEMEEFFKGCVRFENSRCIKSIAVLRAEKTLAVHHKST
jgi:hypothetical protein